MDKFTQGDWTLGEDYAIGVCDDALGIDEIVVSIPQIDQAFYTDDDERMKANLQLMSAAPDLLKALRLFMVQYDMPDRGNRPEIAAARAAIAKATKND